MAAPLKPAFEILDLLGFTIWAQSDCSIGVTYSPPGPDKLRLLGLIAQCTKTSFPEGIVGCSLLASPGLKSAFQRWFAQVSNPTERSLSLARASVSLLKPGPDFKVTVSSFRCFWRTHALFSCHCGVWQPTPAN